LKGRLGFSASFDENAARLLLEFERKPRAVAAPLRFSAHGRGSAAILGNGNFTMRARSGGKAQAGATLAASAFVPLAFA
jgi:hypothetical protein